MAGIPTLKKAISLVAISTPGNIKSYPTGSYVVSPGTDGYVLQSDSTSPTGFSWVSASGGGGGGAPSGPAGGDLAGTYPDPTLAEIMTAATSGSAARVPVVTIDTKGRVTGLSETIISITTSSISGLGTAAGLNFDTDTTLAASSDSRIATQRATKTYADTKVAKSGDTMTGLLTITNSAVDTLLSVSSKGIGELPIKVRTNAGNAAEVGAQAGMDFGFNNSARVTFATAATTGIGAAYDGTAYFFCTGMTNGLRFITDNVLRPIEFWPNSDRSVSIYGTTSRIGGCNSTNAAVLGVRGYFAPATNIGTAQIGVGDKDGFSWQFGRDNVTTGDLIIQPVSSANAVYFNNVIRIMWSNGNVGLGLASATAKLHLPSGSTVASSAPLKFTKGTNLLIAENGAVEFDGDKLYLTITSSTARKEFALNDGAISSGLVAYTTTNGRLTGSSRLSYNGTNLVQSSGTYTITPSLVAQAAIVVSGSNTIGGTSYIDFIKVINTSAGATNINKTMRVDGTGALQVINSAYNQTLLTLENNGNLFVNGTTAATVTSNDATSGSLRFNNNNSQIYDDGNLHIHSRTTGQSLWINANSGSIILGNQSPVAGGAAATAITMGSSTTATAYVSMYGSKTYTIGSYGYVSAGGAGGPLAGTTAPYTLYCNNRIQCAELDATSDERLKDIQGEIPLQEAIDLVNNVKPIKFTWKDGEDKGLKTGFSAQQTHKAGFDHLVGAIKNEKVKEEIDEDGFVSPEQVQLTIAYDQVIPYHTTVIKHLLDKIEKLEQIVAELQAKNK